ncbi:MAG: hypothetical protein KG003_16270 [Bacteroidetes bacterium]|nr:hypothetical protein [Bacteroidota bacterium]
MKNTLLFSLLLVFAFACKKNPPPSKDTNLLCEGNGSADLFPLSVGNYWTYTVKKNGVVQPKVAKILVLKDSVYYGKDYFYLTDSNQMMFGSWRFYRKDTGNHTKFVIPGYSETMEIKKSPALNESWISFFYGRKAVNLNASLKTDNCSYTGLIQVNETDGGPIKDRRYYKKGLGLVYVVYPNSPMAGDSTEYILKDVRIH